MINTKTSDVFKSWCSIMLQLISFHCPSSDYVVSMWKQKIEVPWFRINHNTLGGYLFHFCKKIWKSVCIFYLKIKGILIQRKNLYTKKPHKTQPNNNNKTPKQANKTEANKPSQPNPSKNLKALGIRRAIDGGCQEKQR